MHIKGLFFLMAFALLQGCSGGAKTIEDAVVASGCKDAEVKPDSHNIYNARSAMCSDDGRVYWFPTKEAKETHAEGCKMFGGKSIKEGENWVLYSPSC